ncbi:hypothetical protein BGP_0151 [Beggiatoa sp. PS]|nr:hypothetical protein BGP_0151 [Beggiatoa sp. PS]
MACEINCNSYHFTAAAKRISWANSFGVRRNAEKMVSGNSMAMLTLIYLSPLKNQYNKTLFWNIRKKTN